ncbi:gas vesicle protein [Streptomyces sp. SID8379]|uniref:GvpL/GvpF family gas vesicle protein n=1 Tax=unclassified Streptomyces TaxID=2593676 RepID=UPI000362F5E3|nr:MULTISPECIES: GvpL/GvpF family gas vesicle protein [unclassified Streptomyces]MYW69354.1 gas vesicle protein [Streptomyces sp. SID8379]MYW69411.1 gas vesicle protein [Streptomyces sp. SID8379]
MTTELRYVYAVCGPLDAPLPELPTGVAGAVPRLIRHAGLTAVVSHVPAGEFSESTLRRNLENLDWLSETARAHQTVIAALTSVTSPLPLRLATVFHDDSGVRAMLEAEADSLRASLARLRERVEWGVKVYVEESPAEQAGTSGAASADRASAGSLAAGSGRDYLRRRRAERAGREETLHKAEGFAQDLYDQLSRHADDTRIHPPQNSELARSTGRNVLNAAFLVARSASEAFVEMVDARKGEQPGLRVELTGPWAAYSFCAPPEERTDATSADGAR